MRELRGVKYFFTPFGGTNVRKVITEVMGNLFYNKKAS